ncbi:MAG: hypothetical protein ACXVZ3_02320 [Gaiellaceae bacterium]
MQHVVFDLPGGQASLNGDEVGLRRELPQRGLATHRRRATFRSFSTGPSGKPSRSPFAVPSF